MAPQPIPSASLDPNISFEWPETDPDGMAKSCRAGIYSGTLDYTCVGVTGMLSIELAESAQGEFLEISGGEFTSSPADGVGLKSGLQGSLDCKTLQFSAKTLDGVFGIIDPNMTLTTLGQFEFVLVGTLDESTGVLAGQWMTTDLFTTCMGPWSAMRTR